MNTAVFPNPFFPGIGNAFSFSSIFNAHLIIAVHERLVNIQLFAPQCNPGGIDHFGDHFDGKGWQVLVSTAGKSEYEGEVVFLNILYRNRN